MDLPVMRYRPLQRLLLKSLQTKLPPPARKAALLPLLRRHKGPKHSDPKTRRRPNSDDGYGLSAVFIARLAQLVYDAVNPKLTEVVPDLSHFAGGLLVESVRWLEFVAKQHRSEMVVVMAALTSSCHHSTNNPIMCVLPLIFFCQTPTPVATAFVSSLPICFIASQREEHYVWTIANHHASIQLFLMVYTSLSLLGCILPPDEDTEAEGPCHPQRVRITVSVKRETEDGLLLLCQFQRQKHSPKKKRPHTTRIILSDTVNSSRLVHRSWEHEAPRPVMSSSCRLHYRCMQCRGLCTADASMCTHCGVSLVDVSSLTLRYSWLPLV